MKSVRLAFFVIGWMIALLFGPPGQNHVTEGGAFWFLVAAMNRKGVYV